MYIEKGATVSVSGGTLKVNGRLICDGRLNIGENGYMSLADGSRFVVNTSGTFRYNADGITINRDADYACFGKFTYKYLDDSTAQTIAAKPLCVLAGDSGKLSMVTDGATTGTGIPVLRATACISLWATAPEYGWILRQTKCRISPEFRC